MSNSECSELFSSDDSAFSYEISTEVPDINSILISQAKYIPESVRDDGKWLENGVFATLSSGEYTLGYHGYIPYQNIEQWLPKRVTEFVSKEKGKVWLVFNEKIMNIPIELVFKLVNTPKVPENSKFLVLTRSIRITKEEWIEIKKDFPELKGSRVGEIPANREEIFLLRNEPFVSLSIENSKYIGFCLNEKEYRKYLSDFESEVNAAQ